MKVFNDEEKGINFTISSKKIDMEDCFSDSSSALFIYIQSQKILPIMSSLLLKLYQAIYSPLLNRKTQWETFYWVRETYLGSMLTSTNFINMFGVISSNDKYQTVTFPIAEKNGKLTFSKTQTNTISKVSISDLFIRNNIDKLNKIRTVYYLNIINPHVQTLVKDILFF